MNFPMFSLCKGELMKVLMYIRKDYRKNIAGDSVLLIKTKEYLSKAKVEVDISSNTEENLDRYDIIHLFNTIRVFETYQFLKNTLKYKKKIVVTPIYWNYIKYLSKNPTNNYRISYWKKQNPMRKEIFEKADMILPSSEIEMREIEKNFNIKAPYQVVFNGVDKIFAEGDSNNFLDKFQKKDFVLSVGRISPHKNQLALARVTKRLGTPLVLVGPINDLNYYHQCIQANKDILYISKTCHAKLKDIYAAAKVHALVSWYEIPGLVSLEAALGNCNVLTTKEGSTREYFKKYADYVDPYDVIDIEKKLIQSFKKPFDSSLKEYIIENFLWEKVVEKLISCYNYVTKNNV